MKNTLLRTVVIFVALCIYPSIHAYDFECEGFYYDITSDSTVSVTYEGSTEYQYEGDIIIPEKATFNNKTYQVTEIGPLAFWGAISEQFRFQTILLQLEKKPSLHLH